MTSSQSLARERKFGGGERVVDGGEQIAIAAVEPGDVAAERAVVALIVEGGEPADPA
jgi:hypothetical protein